MAAHANRIVSYFVVVAPHRVGGEDEQAWEASVVDRYPLEDYGDVPLDPGVALFCLPDGVEVMPAEAGPPPPPGFHTFALTNSGGGRSYGVALRFHELMAGGRGGRVRLSSDAPTDTSVESAAAGGAGSEAGDPAAGSAAAAAGGGRGVFVPRVFCVLSNWPLFSVLRAMLWATFTQYAWAATIAPDGSRTSAKDRRRIPAIGDGAGGGPAGRRGVRRWAAKYALSLEQFLCGFVVRARLPALGRRLLMDFGGGCVATVERQRSVALAPLDREAFALLFSLLDAEAVVSIATFLMMEQRVLIHSDDIGRLSAVCEALTALLFPFHWPHVYIPVLPLQLIEYLQAPVPFIMGMHTSFLNTSHGLDCLTSAVIVHLDYGKTVTPMDIELPGGQQVDVAPELPGPVRGRLLARLRSAVPPVDALAAQRSELPDAPGTRGQTSVFLGPADHAGWTTAVRAAFLEALSSLCVGYRKYMSVRRRALSGTPPGGRGRASPEPSGGAGGTEALFDSKRFLRAAPREFRKFLKPFSCSQAFLSFVEFAAHTSEVIPPGMRGEEAELHSLVLGRSDDELDAAEIRLFDWAVYLHRHKPAIDVADAITGLLANRKVAVHVDVAAEAVAYRAGVDDALDGGLKSTARDVVGKALTTALGRVVAARVGASSATVPVKVVDVGASSPSPSPTPTDSDDDDEDEDSVFVGKLRLLDEDMLDRYTPLSDDDSDGESADAASEASSDSVKVRTRARTRTVSDGVMEGMGTRDDDGSDLEPHGARPPPRRRSSGMGISGLNTSMGGRKLAASKRGSVALAMLDQAIDADAGAGGGRLARRASTRKGSVLSREALLKLHGAGSTRDRAATAHSAGLSALLEEGPSRGGDAAGGAGAAGEPAAAAPLMVRNLDTGEMEPLNEALHGVSVHGGDDKARTLSDSDAGAAVGAAIASLKEGGIRAMGSLREEYSKYKGKAATEASSPAALKKKAVAGFGRWKAKFNKLVASPSRASPPPAARAAAGEGAAARQPPPPPPRAAREGASAAGAQRTGAQPTEAAAEEEDAGRPGLGAGGAAAFSRDKASKRPERDSLASLPTPEAI